MSDETIKNTVKNPELLFPEIRSQQFFISADIINRLVSGETVTMEEASAKMYPSPERDKNKREERLSYIQQIIPSNSDGKLMPYINAPVPIVISALEKRWLKSMLMDKRGVFLLPDSLRKKLLSKLKDTDPLPLDAFESIRETGDPTNDDKFQSVLATVWKALVKKRKISYESLDVKGQSHSGTVSPCRLEYDATENRYRLIVWLEDEKRSVKINVSRIKGVKCTAEPIPDNTEKQFQKFLDSHRKSFTMRLYNESNAIDRAFTLFASYDKTADYDDTSDTYEMTLYYYDFDEHEILQAILSLGSAAIVLEPEDLRSKAIEYWKKADALYNAEE